MSCEVRVQFAGLEIGRSVSQRVVDCGVEAWDSYNFGDDSRFRTTVATWHGDTIASAHYASATRGGQCSEENVSESRDEPKKFSWFLTVLLARTSSLRKGRDSPFHQVITGPCASCKRATATGNATLESQRYPREIDDETVVHPFDLE